MVKQKRMSRLIKALWYVSLIVTSAYLLFVYAGFREDQLIFINNRLAGVGREIFFFVSLGIITVLNFVLYILSWNLRKRESDLVEFVKGWLMGLGVVVNFFLIMVFSFLQVFNGGEQFDYSNFGYLIYFSLTLIFLWVLAMPIYIIKAKFQA